MSKLIVYTCGYNCEKTMRQTIDSVLNQTFTDFEYHFINNGSTDGTARVLTEYAAKDSRFIVITRKINHTLSGETNPIIAFLNEKTKEPYNYYMANIDADDWWEPDYLEKLMSFLKENDLDLSLTGSLKYIEETGERKIHTPDISENIILTQKEFAKNYFKYNIFPSAMWGSIIKLELCRKIDFNDLITKVISMPLDTAFMLEYIKNCNKIGIRNDRMYNYRIRMDSATYKYDSKRFYSALGYREILIDFLEKNDAYDDYYKEWVKMVFLSSLSGVISTLKSSNSSSEFKISEALKVLKNDIVRETLATHSGSRNKNDFLTSVRELLSENIVKLENLKDRENANECLRLFAPSCGKFFDYNHIDLYVENPQLSNSLLNDDSTDFVKVLLELIEQNLYKNFDITDLIRKAIPKNTVVSDVCNKEFFELYPSVCQLVLSNKNTEALSEMTEIMLSGQEVSCPEDFLNVYIKLAALENHVEAFLFGNIQKAYFFIDENRKDEAKQIVNDLVEMGAGEVEDVVALKELLN